MNFTTATRVLQTIRSGDEVEWQRGENRVKVNNAANCVPPLDKGTAKKLGIKINVNWGELMILLAHARRQYLTNYWSQSSFFKVTIKGSPGDRQSDWSAFATEFINSKMRKSLKYWELHRSKWAAVVAHGIGPSMWRTPYNWCPDYVAIEDLRIPTDTTLDFENLGWYAVRVTYTPFELGKNLFVDGSRWKTEAIIDILKAYKQINYDYADNHYDWETTPEKLAELIKQDGGYYSSDAMPGIPLWHFYFQDIDKHKNEQWYMRIVPETGYVRGTPNDQFLWEDDEPVAPRWNQLLHCNFGDLNNKAPFLYHSIRSLGFALLEPTFYTNLTRCRMLQHLHDNFNVWLRITDPPDKARPQVQEFGNYSLIRPGVAIVGSVERHQVDPELVDQAMGQLKQLQQEASASYTQQADTGTKKQQTAFETSVKLQQVNAMMEGLILMSTMYEYHQYAEICRRFTLPKSPNADVQEFLQAWKREKIPMRYFNAALWDIVPTSSIGAGNPMLAAANVSQLMEQRPAFDATAQQEILHEFALITTGDPNKARRWVPLGSGRGMTDSVRDAQAIFGTLMQGVPVPFREGLSPVEQAQTLLPLLAGVVARIEQRDNVSTPAEISGISEVAQYIQGLSAQMEGDEANKAIVKQINDGLAKLMNQARAMAQRMQEQQQKQQGAGIDPKAVAQARSTMLITAAKIKSKQLADAQKMDQRQRQFVQQERREDSRTYHTLQRKGLEAAADIAGKTLKTFTNGSGQKKGT